MFSFMSTATGEVALLRCKSSTAASIKVELGDPKGTTAKWHVRKCSVETFVLDSQINLVKALSSGCNWT